MKKGIVLVVILIILLAVFVFFSKFQTPSAPADTGILTSEESGVPMSNYLVEYEPETDVEYPLDYPVVYSVTNNVKVPVYRGEKATALNIVPVSEYPYLVMEYGCGHCDGPRTGSMILNVKTKKVMTLSGKDVLSLDSTQNSARVRDFIYQPVANCQYELCSPDKVPGAESTIDLTSIR